MYAEPTIQRSSFCCRGDRRGSCGAEWVWDWQPADSVAGDDDGDRQRDEDQPAEDLKGPGGVQEGALELRAGGPQRVGHARRGATPTSSASRTSRA